MKALYTSDLGTSHAVIILEECDQIGPASRWNFQAGHNLGGQYVLLLLLYYCIYTGPCRCDMAGRVNASLTILGANLTS